MTKIRLFTLITSLFMLSACAAPFGDSGVRPTPTAIARLAQAGAAAESAQVESAEDSEAQATSGSEATVEPEATSESASPMGMMGGLMGMGRGGNMRAFHSATIPEDYAGTLSPIPADDESLARGEVLFAQNCATCHGETGLGDGPAAAALDPAPPMIAMTSQMLGDDYMLWRISEGGSLEPFNSAMPAWKSVLEVDQRWDAINYVRSLGGAHNMGMASPGMGMGGQGMNANMEEVMRAEMLAAGIEAGVISEEEAALFDDVHAQIDTLRAADPNRQFSGTMQDLQDQLLEELVADGAVSREDADAFYAIHDLLQESGLMP